MNLGFLNRPLVQMLKEWVGGQWIANAWRGDNGAGRVRPIPGPQTQGRDRWLELSGDGTKKAAEWPAGADITSLFFFAIPAPGAVLGITESLATGSLDITSGTAGSIDTVTVNGVDILGAVVPFDTDINTTAANVATQINSNTSTPDYTAEATGPTITITAVDGSGCSPNGYAVLATSTTLTTGNYVDMAGGVAGIHQIYVMVAIDPVKDAVAEAMLTQVESTVDDVGWKPVRIDQNSRIDFTDVLVNGSLAGGSLYAKTVGGCPINLFPGGN